MTRLMKFGFLFVCCMLLLTASSIPPPSNLKKDVKNVCKCYKEFVKLKQKGFPSTSPYYQEARAKATTAIVQVEKNIQEGLYTSEAFNKTIKKKCPDLIKAIREINSETVQN